jgi:hypothetical protein
VSPLKLRGEVKAIKIRNTRQQNPQRPEIQGNKKISPFSLQNTFSKKFAKTSFPRENCEDLNFSLMKAHTRTLNVFSRFGSIWTPKFFSTLMAEKRSGPTWGFWFLWNTIFAVIITVALSFFLSKELNEFEKEAWAEIPDFEIQLENGKLSIDKLEQPFFWEDENAVFVVDIEKKSFDESVLDKYQQGFYLTADKFVGKKNQFETQEFAFSEIEENFSFSRTDAQNWLDENRGTIKTIISIATFIGLWFVFAIWRLLTALWWALMFWVVGLIAGIKGWNFGSAYLAVLNLYFIPLAVEWTLLLGGISIPFSTLLLFGIMFGMNFWSMKEAKKKK